MILLVVAHLVEVNRAPSELAVAVIEQAIDGTGIEGIDESERLAGAYGVLVVLIVDIEADCDTRRRGHVLEPLVVAVLRKSLVGGGEVAVVVVEADGQARDDVGGELGRISLPLLRRVVADECVEEGLADQLLALLIEVLRLDIGVFTGLALNLRLRLGRRVVGMEELVDSAEIDGERVYLAAVRRIHAVRIVGEFRESVRILPHTLDVGVEQVGAVLVDFDARLLIEVRCGVATDTRASVDDEYVLPAPLRDLLGDGQAEKARADD